MRTALLGLLLVGTVGACSSSTDATGTISGDWSVDQSVPGGGFGMTLTQSGSTVAGNGSFRGEAGPAGTFTANGTVDGSKVHLDLVITVTVPNPTTAYSHFDGALVGPSFLIGTLVGDTPPEAAVTVRFRRG